ncbi:uncharacterized protein LOC124370481 [Homalodisca vitripennis]|uniref:uncharacterized protein LOC124370481 n=1 Tax=Homalodisca vitripennis TaxID=197043 RepID=UPI001EECC2A8|nr:uncharacterized protein LOC124370481 [Homalodisca vitripennis]
MASILDDKELCIVCCKKVTNKGVECDSTCKRWFHPDCVQLSAAEYKKIADGVIKTWTCDRADCTTTKIDRKSLALDEILKKISSLATKEDVKESPADPRISNVTVSRDRTQQERKHLTELRNQLEKRTNEESKKLDTCSGHSRLQIYYQNVNGLRSKLHELRLSLATSTHDVLILTETNLNSQISTELGFTNKYDIFRKDRSLDTSSKSSGGGVLVATTKQLRSTTIYNSSNLEVIFVNTSLSPRNNVLLVAVYIPPSSPLQVYSDFAANFEEVMLSATFSQVHVFGDFNIPDADWNAPCSVNVNTPMAIISNVITMFALMQVNQMLNHRGVLFDLILTSSLDVHVQRDQCPLLIEDAHHPSLNCLVPIPAPAVLTYNLTPNPAKCNLRTLHDDLCTFDFASLDAIHDINESFWVLMGTISKSVLKHSPLKKWGFSNFPAWFSRNLKNLIFLKKALHKEYKSTRWEITYQRFAVIRAQCKALAKDCFTAYADHIQEVLPHNPKVFWSYVKNLNRSGSTPTTLRLDGITSTSDQTAADLFADFFSAAFNHDDDVADGPPSTPPSFALLSSIVLNVPEVRQALLSLDDSKGCGPDFIPSSAIKHICNLLAYPLTKLFNRSLFTGVFQYIWKINPQEYNVT